MRNIVPSFVQVKYTNGKAKECLLVLKDVMNVEAAELDVLMIILNGNTQKVEQVSSSDLHKQLKKGNDILCGMSFPFSFNFEMLYLCKGNNCKKT